MRKVAILPRRQEANMNEVNIEIEEISTSLQAVGDLMSADMEISSGGRDRIAVLIIYLTRQLQEKISQARNIKI
jgi:hypothetical protein